MDDTTPCLTKTVHEKVEYNRTEGHTDIFVCVCCGHEFFERLDSSG